MEVKKEDNKVVILLKAGEKPYIDHKKAIEIYFSKITFDTKEEALKCYQDSYEKNCLVISDNERRLSQMDKDALAKINDFANVIEKTKALSKRNSVKIENLIEVHDSYKTLVFNIEKTKEMNEFLEKIINGIKGIK